MAYNSRYKRSGWFNDSHRHYLAAKFGFAGRKYLRPKGAALEAIRARKFAEVQARIAAIENDPNMTDEQKRLELTKPILNEQGNVTAQQGLLELRARYRDPRGEAQTEPTVMINPDKFLSANEFRENVLSQYVWPGETQEDANNRYLEVSNARKELKKIAELKDELRAKMREHVIEDPDVAQQYAVRVATRKALKDYYDEMVEAFGEESPQAEQVDAQLAELDDLIAEEKAFYGPYAERMAALNRRAKELEDRKRELVFHGVPDYSMSVLELPPEAVKKAIYGPYYNPDVEAESALLGTVPNRAWVLSGVTIPEAHEDPEEYADFKRREALVDNYIKMKSAIKQTVDQLGKEYEASNFRPTEEALALRFAHEKEYKDAKAKLDSLMALPRVYDRSTGRFTSQDAIDAARAELNSASANLRKDTQAVEDFYNKKIVYNEMIREMESRAKNLASRGLIPEEDRYYLRVDRERKKLHDDLQYAVDAGLVPVEVDKVPVWQKIRDDPTYQNLRTDFEFAYQQEMPRLQRSLFSWFDPRSKYATYHTGHAQALLQRRMNAWLKEHPHELSPFQLYTAEDYSGYRPRSIVGGVGRRMTAVSSQPQFMIAAEKKAVLDEAAARARAFFETPEGKDVIERTVGVYNRNERGEKLKRSAVRTDAENRRALAELFGNVSRAVGMASVSPPLPGEKYEDYNARSPLGASLYSDVFKMDINIGKYVADRNLMDVDAKRVGPSRSVTNEQVAKELSTPVLPPEPKRKWWPGLGEENVGPRGPSPSPEVRQQLPSPKRFRRK